jgi:hypothetical protein
VCPTLSKTNICCLKCGDSGSLSLLSVRGLLGARRELRYGRRSQHAPPMDAIAARAGQLLAGIGQDVTVVRCRARKRACARRRDAMTASILQLIWFAPFDGTDIGVSWRARRPSNPILLCLLWRTVALHSDHTEACKHSQDHRPKGALSLIFSRQAKASSRHHPYHWECRRFLSSLSIPPGWRGRGELVYRPMVQPDAANGTGRPEDQSARDPKIDAHAVLPEDGVLVRPAARRRLPVDQPLREKILAGGRLQSASSSQESEAV